MKTTGRTKIAESVRNVYVRVIYMMILVTVVLCTGNSQVSAAQVDSSDKIKNGSMEISSNYLTAQISFGYKGYIKYGKSMRISAVINNVGNDFTGKLRILYARTDEHGTTMIQKKFTVKQDDSVRVQFTLPVSSDSEKFNVAICDMADNVMASGKAKISVDTEISDIFVGVLSDTYSKLGYISDSMSTSESSEVSDTGVKGKVFEMSNTDFESEEMLDSVNLIVIDNYDTSKFTSRNLRVLRRWISDGGTLLVGTGSNYAKEFDKLHSTFIKGYVGKTRTINTDFGWSKDDTIRLSSQDVDIDKIDIDIVNLKLEDAKTILSDGDENILSSISMGSGNIIVAEFSLNLPKTVWKYYGSALVTTVENNLSDDTKAELLQEDTDITAGNNSYGYQYEALKINETDILPNLKLYGGILIVYIFMAGPVIYMIMRRRKKRNYLWIAVPALSVFFSVVIYIVGTSTRIQRPYINYLSQITLDDTETDSINKINTLFSITNVSNNAYNIPLNGNYKITPASLNDDYYGSDYSLDDIDAYDYGVEYSDGNTNLIMNKLSAFESVGFLLKQTDKDSGNVNIDVAENDMKLSGTVTNNFPYDLDHCLIYYQGNVLYIGNIKAGECINLDAINESNVYTASAYAYDIEGLIGDAMDGYLSDSTTNSDLRRKVGMVEEYGAENTNADAWFYGFSSDGSEDTFTSKFDCDKYGVTGLCKNIDVSETIDGYEVIDPLEDYAVTYNSNYTNGIDVYSGAADQFQVTYRFPEGFTLKELIYSEQTAGGGEFLISSGTYVDSGFIGQVSVRNKMNGNLEDLFDSGIETKISNMDEYLNNDGSLTLYYKVNSQSGSNIGSYRLPGVKLAGSYDN